MLVAPGLAAAAPLSGQSQGTWVSTSPCVYKDYVQIRSHKQEFFPLSLTPIQHHRVHSNMHLLFLTAFSNTNLVLMTAVSELLHHIPVKFSNVRSSFCLQSYRIQSELPFFKVIVGQPLSYPSLSVSLSCIYNT